METLREFFIEELLEKRRMNCRFNLGESGFQNLRLGELVERLGIGWDQLAEVGLDDAPNVGREDLREEIAKLYPSTKKENVLVTTGTSEAIYLFLASVLRKNDVVRLFWPSFQSLYEIPLSLGCQIERVNILGKNTLDVRELLSQKAKLYILNHPHNPSGLMISKSDQEFLRKSILENPNVFYLFDEHYRFLDPSPEVFSGAMISKNSFATGSITKCFGVVGLKIGWIVGEKSFLQKLRSFKDYLTHTVNPISEFLCLEILRKRKLLLDPLVSRLEKNKMVLLENLKTFRSIDFAKYIPLQSGIVSFVPLRKTVKGEIVCKSLEYVNRLYEDTGVFLLPGTDFEEEGYVRVGLGTNEKSFALAIEAWRNWDQENF